MLIQHNDNVFLDMAGKHHLCGIYLKGDVSEFTAFHVPKDVTHHSSAGLYWFPNLQEIIADPESPVYETHDGCLYTKRGEILYIPHGKTRLHMDACAKDFDPRVFSDHLNLTEIDTRDNDRYIYKDGCLYSKEMTSLYFVSSQVRELVIPASVDRISNCVFDHVYDKIQVAGGNSHFSMRDGILLEALSDERQKVLYVAPGVETICLPNRFTADPLCMRHCRSVTTVSFPYDSKDELAPFLNPKKRIAYTIRFEDGVSVAFEPYPLSVKQYLTVLSGSNVDVRKGTEQIYLDIYFMGKILTPAQKHNFRLSVMQILKYLIDTNDTKRMLKVLKDGRLVTKRNWRRLVCYADAVGEKEMQELLLQPRQLPERIIL